jgi:hypothetical protein
VTEGASSISCPKDTVPTYLEFLVALHTLTPGWIACDLTHSSFKTDTLSYSRVHGLLVCSVRYDIMIYNIFVKYLVGASSFSIVM